MLTAPPADDKEETMSLMGRAWPLGFPLNASMTALMASSFVTGVSAVTEGPVPISIRSKCLYARSRDGH